MAGAGVELGGAGSRQFLRVDVKGEGAFLPVGQFGRFLAPAVRCGKHEWQVARQILDVIAPAEVGVAGNNICTEHTRCSQCEKETPTNNKGFAPGAASDSMFVVGLHFRLPMFFNSVSAHAAANAASLITQSNSTTEMSRRKFAFNSAPNASSAAGSWKGPPGAPITLTPRSGNSTVTGPREAFSFSAKMRPICAFSSSVVRMSVTCGLCW